jgi:peptidyl-prolyl cis-trans isomerase SurA
MMRLKLTALALLMAMGATAQQQEDPEVMSVNGHKIMRSEFEYYLNRDSIVTDKRYIKMYAEEFADRKLKLYKALDMGLDTTTAVRAEVEGYRGALAKSYLTDSDTEELEARARYNRMKAKLSLGYVNISRIFRRLPQNATNRAIAQAEQQIDSAYNVLQSSPALFDDLVKRLSDDKRTTDVGPLEMTEEFESNVFSLKEGETSKPFFTPEGLQIVRVNRRGELPAYEEMRDELKRQIVHRATKPVLERLKSECDFSERSKAVTALLAGNDTDEQLFTIKGNSYTGADFRRFAKVYPRERSKQYEAFVMKCLMDYESSHIEELHPEHEMKIKEYKENLLIAVVERLEEPTSEEYESGLEKYFEEHRSNYKWEPFKYRGVVVLAVSNSVAKRIKKEMKRVPHEQWPDSIAARYNVDGTVKAKAEYGLFSQGDNDAIDLIVYGTGSVSTTDGFPCAFAIGDKVKRAESVEEAGEELRNDYDAHLKEQSLKRLRHGSAVEIKQEVLKTVNNH